ncbi:GNAT family N-acetyltransferase [Anaerosolibacter sp.]|uniref:GNAT family N-acetyltransferase n=1 Tax=Anaerosolibacter sp. TaxID=1872527 RepID=UPI0039EF00AC
MIFRLANEKDIDKLAQLRWEHEYEVEKESFKVSKDDFMKECAAFLKDGLQTGNWVYWIAEENNKIVANIYVHRIRKVPKPQKLFNEIGYVTNVHTRIEYRNQGIGEQLLKKVKEWAIENNIESLFVWPSEKAVSFYERQGFKAENDIMELEL